MEKKLDGNYTRMLRAILNKSWRQYSTKQLLYGHRPPFTKTIKIRRTRHAGHCWRSRDELVSDVLRWIPSHGRAKTGRPARTFIQQLCADTGCSPDDQPKAMDDREGWRESVRNIRADSATWWWWWFRGCCPVLWLLQQGEISFVKFSITRTENKRKIYMWIKRGKSPLMKLLQCVCVCVFYKPILPCVHWGLEPD